MTDESVNAGMATPAAGYTLALRPGTQLGERYAVLRLLSGASDFELAYLAHDAQTGGAVVLEELLPRGLVGRGADGTTVRAHSLDDEREFVRALRRYVREAEARLDIRHHALPTVLDVVEAHGTAYVVTAHHDAERLSDRLLAMGGRIAPAAATSLVMELLGALETLHAEGIVHRDLSPQTVHVRSDGSPLLLGSGAWRHVPGRTREPVAGFAAIEQYGGRDVGPWSDVHGAAAILYYALTGVVPPSAIDRAAGAALRAPGAWARDISPPLANAVVRGLALSPDGRPHSAAEFRRQLEDAMAMSAEQSLPHGMIALPQELAAAAASPRDPMRADDDPVAMPFTLSAHGVVVPSEESGMERALRRVSAVAARLTGRRSVGRDEEPDEVADTSAARAPALDAVLVRATVPLESTSMVPAAGAAMVPEPHAESTSLVPDAASTAALAMVLTPRPRRVKRMVMLALGGVAVAGMALVAAFRPLRLGPSAGAESPSDGARRSAAVGVAASSGALRAVPPAAPATPAASPTALLQGSPGPAAPPNSTAVSVSRSIVTRPSPTTRARSAPASQQAELPRLPTIAAPNIAIPDASTAPRLASDVVMDARSRISVAREQAERGNYGAARETLTGALARIDSAGTNAGEGEALRGLRREVEAAVRRTTDACGAESEMRRRRGLAALTCS